MMMPMTNANKDHIIMNVVFISSTIRERFRTFLYLAVENSFSLSKRGVSISDRGGDYCDDDLSTPP